jgi:hypothetical protein
MGTVSVDSGVSVTLRHRSRLQSHTLIVASQLPAGWLRIRVTWRNYATGLCTKKIPACANNA